MQSEDKKYKIILHIAGASNSCQLSDEYTLDEVHNYIKEANTNGVILVISKGFSKWYPARKIDSIEFNESHR
jgi:hypothetical protein